MTITGLAASSARAHDFWILPSSFEPASDAAVAFHLAVGQQWAGDPFPRNEARIVHFVLVGPHGDTPIAGAEGVDPAGVARVGAAGLYLAGYESNNAKLELEPDKFEAYLRLEGLEPVIAERSRRGESQQGSHEVYARCAKSLLRVGGSEGPKNAQVFDRALGFTLEIIPEKNPYSYVTSPGKPVSLPFRVLYQGKPLAGALVVAMVKDAPRSPVQARSDRRGRVELALDAPGVWLVKTVHMVRLEAESVKLQGAEWQSYWASLTFTLPAR
ncbi:MAG: DUF4198 domain-containing protein [Acidobacteriota bacterium]